MLSDEDWAGCKITDVLEPPSLGWVLRAEQNLDPDLKYQGWSFSLAIICYWCQSNTWNIANLILDPIWLVSVYVGEQRDAYPGKI